MAHATTAHNAPHSAHGAAGFAAAIEALTERVSRYRLFRRTLAEMTELDARERAELGFSRQNPRAAAYEAVFGARG